MADRRYSRFKYGTHRKYGSSGMTTLLWALEIDWDNDGVFDGGNEGRQLRALSIERGRARLFTSGAQGEARFGRMQPGTCRLVLDNNERLYDPHNINSPLFPNVAPGRDVRLRVTVGSGGPTFTLFRGAIDDIDAAGYLRDPLATIRVSDGWRLLADRRAITALRAGGRTDQAMGDVLDAIAWPAGWGRNLSNGSDVVPYFWADNQAAYDVIHELAESEQGLVWVGADGALNFLSRGDLYGQAAVVTLTDDLLGEPVIGRPWDFVKNYVRVQAYPRLATAQTEIWRLDETPLLTPGESLTIWAEYKDSANRRAPATDVVTPVSGTDYTMNTAADGSGVNLTANFAVTPTLYGSIAKLVVANTGASAGYITLLKLRGRPLEALNVAAYIAEDAGSQAVYGARQLTLDLPWQQSALAAKDFGDWLVSWLASPQPDAVVEITNRPELQFGYDVGTYLLYDSTTLGLTQRFRIGHVRHDSLESMQSIRTRWTLEPVDDVQQFWLLGETGFSEIGETTRLAY